MFLLDKWSCRRRDGSCGPHSCSVGGRPISPCPGTVVPSPSWAPWCHLPPRHHDAASLPGTVVPSPCPGTVVPPSSRALWWRLPPGRCGAASILGILGCKGSSLGLVPQRVVPFWLEGRPGTGLRVHAAAAESLPCGAWRAPPFGSSSWQHWGKGLAAERRLDLGSQCPGQQPGRDWLQALRLCQGRAGTPTSPCQLREPGRGSLRPSGTVLVGRGPSACASLKGPSRALLWLGGWCDPPSLSSPSLVTGVAPFTLGPLLKWCLGPGQRTPFPAVGDGGDVDSGRLLFWGASRGRASPSTGQPPCHPVCRPSSPSPRPSSGDPSRVKAGHKHVETGRVGCLAQCSLHRGADRAQVPQAWLPSLLLSPGVPESCLPLSARPVGQCWLRVLACGGCDENQGPLCVGGF
ncbi:LOW QUALITY PROTEIN: uncharacterized protein LOC115838314 [Nomascus leucogenys]|uniref:LOW QUALITY PROTEIN: uncharacterized protein LOC115838314 n=1 Tax=Nomascus leucogenys TaxID=61853 RepID=UPI00122DA091|nr:LOW QUALITY PROTEIN: uncharacterized protein LOC115838314 [Nomascus leucogenys]